MVENTQQSSPQHPPALQPALEISPVAFNTAIFDRPNGTSPNESRERQSLALNNGDSKGPHDNDDDDDDDASSIASMRHDPFSSTCPATPPIYSPPIVNQSPYFFSASQTPYSNASTTTTLHPQSRTLSIQSLISVSTNATGESSIDDDEERKMNGGGGGSGAVDHDAESVGGVSIEDPDVRMAAEALGDLRADFISSPPSVPMSPPNGMAPSSPTATRSTASAAVVNSKGAPAAAVNPNDENEPLLNLIGVAHPYIGQAVAAGRNVYRGGKRYSPRFRYGAEMVERAAGPMSSVVSFAAQHTGVEGVLRRRLEARSQNATPMGPPAAPTKGHKEMNGHANGTTTSLEAQAAAGVKVKKRRKATKHQSNGDMEVDEVTSVVDEEEDEPELTHKNGGELVEVKKSVVTTENWQRRLMLQTAGAGVALSEESLKSLKYCLEWLRWANIHLDKVIVALRNVLDEWDQHNYLASPPTSPTALNGLHSGDHQQQQLQLQKKIDSLRGEVVLTLKRVVDVVSTYAGGALPENARIVVKACITNLPRRWALVAASPSAQPSKASTPVPGATGDEENGSSTPKPSNALTVSTRRSSIASLTSNSPETDQNHRVLLLAKEGLDMLHQVSSIVEGTLIRAEEWCDRLGRRKPSISSYSAVGWDKNDVEMRDSMNGTPTPNEDQRMIMAGGERESAKAA